MKVTTLILAGGKSSRMGQDKAFLKFKEQTFVEHIIEQVRPLSKDIIISRNDNELDYLGYKVIHDRENNGGPVYALATCFSNIQSDLILVISCDVPQVVTQDFNFLIDKHAASFDVTCFTYKERIMPLVGLYSQNSFVAFQRAIASKQKRLFTVLDSLKVQTIEYRGANGLININTPEDLKELA